MGTQWEIHRKGCRETHIGTETSRGTESNREQQRGRKKRGGAEKNKKKPTERRVRKEKREGARKNQKEADKYTKQRRDGSRQRTLEDNEKTSRERTHNRERKTNKGDEEIYSAKRVAALKHRTPLPGARREDAQQRENMKRKGRRINERVATLPDGKKKGKQARGQDEKKRMKKGDPYVLCRLVEQSSQGLVLCKLHIARIWIRVVPPKGATCDFS